MAIEITDEMRRAVLGELCERVGHRIDINQVASYDGRIKAKDPKQLPHLVCSVCGETWIVVHRGGRDYAAADRRFRERLVEGDPDKVAPA